MDLIFKKTGIQIPNIGQTSNPLFFYCSVSRSVGQSVGQSIGQSIGHSVGQSVGHSVIQSVGQS